MRPRLVLLTLGLLLLAPPGSPAQTDPSFRLGTHALRRILHDHDFKPLDAWEDLGDEPEKTVLIILGRPDTGFDGELRLGSGADVAKTTLLQFLNDGGAVLIATDHPLRSPSVVRACNHAVGSNKVRAWPTPPTTQWERVAREDARRSGWFATEIEDTAVYRGKAHGLADCIIPRPTPGDMPPLFFNLRAGQQRLPIQLATNRPSYLLPSALRRRDVRVLATFPPGCWYENEGWLRKGLDRAFAVSATYGDGRILLLADHSVFINEMMLQQDNGNVEFAFNTASWLKEGKRDRVLFIEDGRIETELNIPIRYTPVDMVAAQQALTEAINKQILTWQERHALDNGLNEALINKLNVTPGRALFNRVSDQNFYYLTALALGLGIVIYGIYRLSLATHRREPGVRTLGAELSLHRPVLTAFEQRHASAEQADALGDYAQQLVREWLAAIDLLPPEQDNVPAGPALRLHIESQSGWWQRMTFRQWLNQAWKLAHREEPAPMDEHAFRTLLARLEELQQAIASGQLRVTVAG